MPYDERLLPAVKKKDWLVEAIQSPAEQHYPQPNILGTLHSPEMSGEPKPLSEKAQREADLPIAVFGENLVRKKPG